MIKTVKKNRKKIKKLAKQIVALQNKIIKKEAMIEKLSKENLKICPHENIEDTGGMCGSIIQCHDCGEILNTSM